jgi:hypothetical protein
MKELKIKTQEDNISPIQALEIALTFFENKEFGSGDDVTTIQEKKSGKKFVIVRSLVENPLYHSITIFTEEYVEKFKERIKNQQENQK